MSIDDARRFGAEIVQLASQSPLLDEMARAVLAQLHVYFVPQRNFEAPGPPAPPPQPPPFPDAAPADFAPLAHDSFF
jgi:hypothetical protein